jgi:hypothetical protein
LLKILGKEEKEMLGEEEGFIFNFVKNTTSPKKHNSGLF